MVEETYDGDGLSGSHSDGGSRAASLASSLDESGGHSGSGVSGDGSLALITRALLGVAIGGCGLSLSICQWSSMRQESGYIQPKRCAR